VEDDRREEARRETMILPRFEYKRPRNLSQAIEFYKSSGGAALFLAGGTDIVPRMKLRLEKPTVVIDLKGIAGLAKIKVSEGWFRIGANVTLFDLKNDKTVRECFPALLESLDGTSSETLQMRGTLGGNILQETRCLFYNKPDTWRKAKGFCLKMGGNVCNAAKGAKTCFANYCSDNAPALLTLGTEVKLTGPDGERRIPLLEIYTGKSDKPFRLFPGEILTEFLIPEKLTSGGYLKIRVRDSIDYPLVGVALSSVKGKGWVSLGGIGARPLLFKFDKKKDAERVAEEATAQVKPVGNTVLSAAYRKRMAGVLIKRIWKKVLGEGRV
jgi:4-hydroxybenzoyl-CoA reductase subunit beta